MGTADSRPKYWPTEPAAAVDDRADGRVQRFVQGVHWGDRHAVGH